MVRRTLRCLLLAWGATTCFYLAIALAVDAAFFARFERAVWYTTPLPPEMFWSILATFRLTDLRLWWPLGYVLLAIFTTTLLLAHHVRDMPRTFLIIAIPQLVILPLLPAGWSSWSSEGFYLFTGGSVDGEWLHEGWALLEAGALWLIVPVAISVSASFEIIARYIVSRRTTRCNPASRRGAA